MEKRYQVFVSSTFTDLENERRGVMESLMKMDCIPAGMELFPAADEEQWAFIQKVIDDCDYYLLIIGGRYGSTTAEGISFTEKEFDYAVEKKIHVIALLHGEPENIPAGKSEVDSAARKRLDSFRKKVKTNRLIKTWTTAPGLAAEVVLSVSHAIKAHPRLGWVRGGSNSNPALLEQLNELRQRNDALERKLAQELSSRRSPTIPNLAAATSKYTLHGSYVDGNSVFSWDATGTWEEIISAIGPQILDPLPEASALKSLPSALFTYFCKRKEFAISLSAGVHDTIKVQLLALGYVTFENQFWEITEVGKQVMFQTRTVKDTDKPM